MTSLFTHTSGHHLETEDGARIYYEETGNPQGPCLLLLHGGLGSMADLDRTSLGFLAGGGYRLVAVDFRGHGKSTLGGKRCASLCYSLYQSDTEAVLEHLELRELACILGFSDGGVVAYRMAASGSSFAARIVTIGASWRLLPDDPSIPFLKGMTTERWAAKFPDAIPQYNQTNPQPDFDRLLSQAIGLWTDTSSKTGYPNESVQRIRVPCLLVRGENDHLFALEEGQALQKALASSKCRFLDLPEAGHEAHKDSPQEFQRAVTRFLSES